MGKMQRSKGRRGELEVLARLNALGGDGELLYGQPELGGKDGDVNTLFGRFEVKRRAAFPAWLNLPENVRGCYMRRDRGEWMVVLRASDFERLLPEPVLIETTTDAAKLTMAEVDSPALHGDEIECSSSE